VKESKIVLKVRNPTTHHFLPFHLCNYQNPLNPLHYFHPLHPPRTFNPHANPACNKNSPNFLLTWEAKMLDNWFVINKRNVCQMLLNLLIPVMMLIVMTLEKIPNWIMQVWISLGKEFSMRERVWFAWGKIMRLRQFCFGMVVGLVDGFQSRFDYRV